MQKRKLDTTLIIRLNEEEKQKAKVVSKTAGIPNLSIFIRNLIKDEIEYHEKQYGSIPVKDRSV